jgi:hypothetical protein
VQTVPLVGGTGISVEEINGEVKVSIIDLSIMGPTGPTGSTGPTGATGTYNSIPIAAGNGIALNVVNGILVISLA